jgi:aryl-alcohol dehydrogenase-like predicted oxidoreductase
MTLGTDEFQAQRIIESALEQGINYFDTADLYDFGENERIVGKALKAVRKNVIIATKVGNRWNEKKDKWDWDPSKTYIKEQVKQSLKRLDTDYIDLYQLHGGTMLDSIEETIEAFEELVKEGYVKYYGISSIRPNVIREYVNKSSITSVMMQYSLLDRRPEEMALSLLKEHGISMVCRGVLAKGILTEKKWEDLHSKILSNGYLQYSSVELQELLTLLKEKFASNRSLSDIAIQYCLAHDAVASVVIGASTPDQVRRNAQAVQSRKLSIEEKQLLQEITRADIYQEHRE